MSIGCMCAVFEVEKELVVSDLIVSVEKCQTWNINAGFGLTDDIVHVGFVCCKQDLNFEVISLIGLQYCTWYLKLGIKL